LRTNAGKGTTVEVVVPLSVASFHALVVEVSGGTIAIPLDAVRGC
jgi:chemotaxis protein histidine kinase CheA